MEKNSKYKTIRPPAWFEVPQELLDRTIRPIVSLGYYVRITFSNWPGDKTIGEMWVYEGRVLSDKESKEIATEPMGRFDTLNFRKDDVSDAGETDWKITTCTASGIAGKIYEAITDAKGKIISFEQVGEWIF